MFSILASTEVSLLPTPTDIFLAFLHGMWQAFVLLLWAMPWWVWVFLIALLLYKVYKRLEWMATPVELRRPRRRRRQHDW